MTVSAGGSNEFRIGAVLRRSFAILFKHIVPFGLISLLLLVVPSFVIEFIVISQGPESSWGLAIVQNSSADTKHKHRRHPFERFEQTSQTVLTWWAGSRGDGGLTG